MAEMGIDTSVRRWRPRRACASIRSLADQPEGGGLGGAGRQHAVGEQAVLDQPLEAALDEAPELDEAARRGLHQHVIGRGRVERVAGIGHDGERHLDAAARNELEGRQEIAEIAPQPAEQRHGGGRGFDGQKGRLDLGRLGEQLQADAP